MGKLYTLDHKLLTETPEIRVGEKIYPVDNRQKTVSAIQQRTTGFNGDDFNAEIVEVMGLALGKKAAEELDNMNLPFPAWQKLFSLVMAAVTGEEPEEIESRFHQPDEDRAG